MISVLATTSTTTAPSSISGLASLIPFILIAGLFVLMTLPQRRMRKQQQTLQDSLSVGDSVRTAGGIHGRILSLDDTTALIEVESGKLRLERRAISAKLES
jgi:preprotein translocase subunit YajC